MKITYLTIDPILREFFDARLEGKKGAARLRIERCEASLRAYLEAHGERILETGTLNLLKAEREFQPIGAFARVARGDDLLFALHGFIKDQLPDDVAEKKVQLELTEALIATVLNRRPNNGDDLSCILIDLRVGLNRGRESVGLRPRPLD